MTRPSPDLPVYSISVASELTGVQPQALRDYESKGLIAPGRTDGGTRRYSQADVDRVHAITDLLSGGANLTGAKRILELQAELDALRTEITTLRAQARRRDR